MHTWILEGDSYRCTRHPDVAPFTAVEGCTCCHADPGPAPGSDVDLLPEAPAGCLSSIDLERRFVAAADQLDAQVARLIAAAAPSSPPRARRGKRAAPRIDYHGVNALAKLCDVRAKYLRAAGELARNREHETIQRIRELRDRQLGGGRAHGVAN